MRGVILMYRKFIKFLKRKRNLMIRRKRVLNFKKRILNAHKQQEEMRIKNLINFVDAKIC